MSVIIGSVTTVLIDGVSDGYQSVNWNISRQPTRLWELGSWTPWKTQVGATVTVSLTTYAGALSAVLLPAVTSCVDSTIKKNVLINASTCGAGTTKTINYAGMYLTSYSYSKGDPTGFGTESWSFQKWIDSGVSGDFITIPLPTLVLRGQTEGSRFGDVGNGSTDLGVRFIDDPGPAPATNYHIVIGDQGSVSAGFPGLGNANITQLGLVDRIGGGKLQAGGEIGQSNATIPHTPIYLG
jgi:hypothetical protein